MYWGIECKKCGNSTLKSLCYDNSGYLCHRCSRFSIPDAQELYSLLTSYLITRCETEAANVLDKCTLRYEARKIIEDSYKNFGIEYFILSYICSAYEDNFIKEILLNTNSKINKTIFNALNSVIPSNSCSIFVGDYSNGREILDEHYHMLQENILGKNLERKTEVNSISDKSIINQSLGNNQFKEWENFRFRSESEIRIAAAFDKVKGVLFFPNCKARLGPHESRLNREPDFLVCYRGKWGILEVDGEPFHPATRTVEDHKRDRLFRLHGVRVVEHFDAAECFENPDGVVRKFLYILSKS